MYLPYHIIVDLAPAKFDFASNLCVPDFAARATVDIYR